MTRNSLAPPYEIIQNKPKGHSISSLKSFEEKMASLQNWREGVGTPCDFLFRGQADEKWALETTIEREGHNLDFDSYLCDVKNCSPEIQTYTGKSWVTDLPKYNGVGDLFQNKFPNSQCYLYFAWLRHYGFPSPLLDWSQSEYIALYFALREKCEGATAAVYVYLRSSKKHGQVTGSSGPTIYHFGNTVQVNERHMVQQGEYTLCACEETGKIKFCAHEKNGNQIDQDLVWKFTIPFGVKNEILGRLMKMNINAYTLFQTTDALAEMLTYKHFRK